MKIGGKYYRSIWLDKADNNVKIIDQRKLPWSFEIETLKTASDVFTAIQDMHLRGAPLIGVAAAFGLYLESKNTNEDYPFQLIKRTAEYLSGSRPTAVNLFFALEQSMSEISENTGIEQAQQKLLHSALELAESEVENCRRIGVFGLELIREISEKKNGKTVNILTHCNAGWLACVDFGTATAPIYAAFDEGVPVHVWVDETRPRNQGAKLTAFELSEHGVPNTLIADNAGGYLMQKGDVDIVIVGSDRTALNGDVANKIGTYIKALAAADNNIPFYVALPTSTIDKNTENGIRDIPVEYRSGDEVKIMDGKVGNEIRNVEICPSGFQAINPAFDITPAKFVTSLITEKGIIKAEKQAIRKILK